MKKWLNWSSFLLLCLCGILGLELFLMLDYAVVFCGGMLPLYTPVFFVPAAALILLLWFRNRWKWVLKAVVMLPLVIGILAGAGYLCWQGFSSSAVYENPDSGKFRIYGDRNVMVIVPHQDDELNILGGVMEEYIRYGSDLRVVFVTNGDYTVSAEKRLSEALAVCKNIGMPEENVIFLGYGNEWDANGPHIYNGEADQTVASHIGKTETYGLADHPAYHEGNAYTRNNLESDLKDVILEYRPDVLFCTDYDHHIDHRATSLLFEKVMGRILKDNPDYTPVVYKGYAYGTAWESEPDFYAENILSTQNLFGEPYDQKPAVYRWEDRVRLPVAGDTLSRSIFSAPAYETLGLHDSQGAICFADRVINGDRVFWRRDTTSLVLHGNVTATSGEAALLHDFMLVETKDLINSGRRPYDGVWIPEQTDAVREVTVELKESVDISRIVLYDHPSSDNNVLNAVITFADGTSMETGPLDPKGAATSVSVNKTSVSAFSVSLVETEGELAGLSELEAFREEPVQDGCFVKLMDQEENFVYDYRTAPDGQAEFVLYTHGDLPEVTAQNYTVETASETGSAELDGSVIRVNCPVGQTVVLNVTCSAAGVSDSIVIRNPGLIARGWTDFWRMVEEAFYVRYISSEGCMIPRLNRVRVWERISYVLSHI